jgi:hypothetical protein
MTDNELKLWTVVLALGFAMWALYFMRGLGFFNSQKVYDRTKFAWNTYMQANSWDQKVVALLMGFFVITYSLTVSFLGFVLAFLGLVMGAVFNYQPLQFLVDLFKAIAAWVDGGATQMQAGPITAETRI